MASDNPYHLPDGCEHPKPAALDEFWRDARAALPDKTLPASFQVRWIGGDDATTRQILTHIRNGDKIGTVSVPEVIEYHGQHVPAVGDAIILIHMDGTPDALIQITRTQTIAYRDINETHTGLDGPRIRDPKIWLSIHKPYFDELLAPAGKHCTGDTPVTFETFECLYAI